MFILLTLGLIVGVVLMTPLSLEIAIDSRAPHFSARPRWGWLRLRKSEGQPEHQKRPRATRGSRRGRPPSLRKLRAVLRNGAFRRSLARWGKRLVRHLRPRRLRIRCRFGLGDPADTGRVCGLLAPLMLALSHGGLDDVVLEADWLRRTWELQVRGVVRFVPGVILGLALGFLLTPAFWRALFDYARA